MHFNIKWLDQELASNKGISPGFHFLRHLLSTLILMHHCRVAVFGVDIVTPGYIKAAPIAAQLAANIPLRLLCVEFLRPGLFAMVGMFFALSGFLVFGSAIRTQKIKTFFANRALRLLPALSVEVFLSALVLGPLVTDLPLTSYFSDPKFFHYFGNIIGDVHFTLPGVFMHNPWPDYVNVNLWTLPAELACYILMLCMMVVGLTGQKRLFGCLVVLIFIVIQSLEIISPDLLSVRANTTYFAPWFIVFLFLLGAAMFANADLVPMHPVLFILAGLGYWALILTDVMQCMAGFLLAYCTVYIGMMRFTWFDRICKMDLSYGIYLYGFPIVQALVFFLHPRLHGLGPTIEYLIIQPCAIILTSSFAAASWLAIEKPALKLKRYLAASQ